MIKKMEGSMGDLLIEKKDYTYLDWNKIRSSSGTAGSFLKATESNRNGKIYYKLSNFDSINGIVGHECVNELIVSRLLDILGIEHLQYRLIHGDVQIEGKVYETYFCASDSFRNKSERKMTFEDYFQMCKKAEEIPIQFAIRKGWQNEVYQMLLVDFLILNRDRHGANIEVIMDKKGNVRLAPLFNHGLSLLFHCRNEEEVKQYDIMEDKPVQSYLGGNSTRENLKFIPKENKFINQKLSEQDKEYLLDGLKGILSQEHLEKIWDMIWKRWKYYEGMFNI